MPNEREVVSGAFNPYQLTEKHQKSYCAGRFEEIKEELCSLNKYHEWNGYPLEYLYHP